MQESQYIVEVRHHHEQQQNTDADILGVYHKVLRRLAASYHLVEQEEHVSAVERRDRQDVHKGEDDAEEAVINQNECQFHCDGNRLPIAPKPPSDFAPSAEKRYFMSPT